METINSFFSDCIRWASKSYFLRKYRISDYLHYLRSNCQKAHILAVTHFTHGNNKWVFFRFHSTILKIVFFRKLIISDRDSVSIEITNRDLIEYLNYSRKNRKKLILTINAEISYSAGCTESLYFVSRKIPEITYIQVRFRPFIGILRFWNPSGSLRFQNLTDSRFWDS